MAGYLNSANENGSISNALVLPKHPVVPPNGIVRIVVRSWAYPILRRLLILELRRNDLSLFFLLFFFLLFFFLLFFFLLFFFLLFFFLLFFFLLFFFLLFFFLLFFFLLFFFLLFFFLLFFFLLFFFLLFFFLLFFFLLFFFLLFFFLLFFFLLFFFLLFFFLLFFFLLFFFLLFFLLFLPGFSRCVMTMMKGWGRGEWNQVRWIIHFSISAVEPSLEWLLLLPFSTFFLPRKIWFGSISLRRLLDSCISNRVYIYIYFFSLLASLGRHGFFSFFLSFTSSLL